MMPSIGGFELVVIAIVALLVVGPKDLPVLMRKVGAVMGRMRAMAADFRASFDEMARQSELDDLRREVEALRTGQLAAPLRDADALVHEIDEGLRIAPDYEPAPTPTWVDDDVASPDAADDEVAPAPETPEAEAAPPRKETPPEEDRVSQAYDDEGDIESSRAPLLDHLIELRSRLLICVAAVAAAFVLCFAFAGQIYLFLLHPFEVAGGLLAAQKASGGQHGPFDLLLALMGLKDVPPMESGGLKLVFTAPLEFFFAKLKLAAFGAIILAFPVIAWQLYRFVAPGLYKRERKAFLPFLLASPVLFLAGAALVYFVMLPFVLWFSLSQQIVGPGNVSIEMLTKVSEYLSLVTTLVLAFGLCFQLPVVLSLLGMAGILDSKQLASGRRYAIVGIVVLAAVVTPPDPISQLMLAAPLVLLYEVSIWCVRLIEFRRRKDEARELAEA